jgi:hypothetical protein
MRNKSGWGMRWCWVGVFDGPVGVGHFQWCFLCRHLRTRAKTWVECPRQVWNVQRLRGHTCCLRNSKKSRKCDWSMGARKRIRMRA